MSFRTTYILFGILVGLLGLFALSVTLGTKPGQENLVLAGLKSANVKDSDIDGLTIVSRPTKDGEPVTWEFEKADKKWRLKEPYPARVDNFLLDQVVRELIDLRKDDRSPDLPRNLGMHGLDTPAIEATLKKAGKPVGTVKLGGVTLGSDNLVYAAAAESRRPMAVRRRDLNGLLVYGDKPGATSAADLLKPLTDFRSKDLLLEGTFSPWDNTTALKVSDPAGKAGAVALKRGDDGTWKYETPSGYGEADLDGEEPTTPAIEARAPSGVKPLFNLLTNLKAGGADDFVAPGGNLADYGLEPGKESLRVDVTRKPAEGQSAGTTETLLIGKAADEKGEKLYAKLDGEPAVVKVTAKQVEPLRKLLDRPGAMRDRNLVSVNSGLVDAIDLKAGGDPVELRKTGDAAAWKLYDSAGSSQPANSAAVTALLEALTAKRQVKDFPEAPKSDADYGYDRPAAEVSLWSGGIEKPKEESKSEAKKDEKPKLKGEPTVKLIFGKKDKDLIHVRRIAGGTKMELALPDSLLAAVSKTRIDFIDPVLSSFVEGSATKLTLDQGGKSVVVAKADGSAGWAYEAPAERKGRPADADKVRAALAALSTLRVVKPIAEKATDKDLERWELKPGALRATVTVKDGDKTTEKVYLFGADAENKADRYAKLGDRDLVFLAAKSALEPLTADLQDPLVFKLDKSKVKQLKLTGWGNVTGGTTLDLERKGPTEWEAKGMAPFPIDGGRVELFLAGLEAVRAEKFIAQTGGPTADHGFDPKKGQFAIEIQLDGEKEPITLTLGGMDADKKHYYATSNKLPGAVFLVDKGKFEKYLEKPVVFGKD